MKKQSVSRQKAETKSDVAHLDAAIAEITATTTQRLKRWWKPLLAVVVALVAGLLLYQGVHALREQKDASLNDRAHRLFTSSAASKDDYKLDSAELQALLSDVRGNSIEPFVYRSAVEHYLDQAGKLARKAKEDEKKSADPADPAVTPATPLTPPAAASAAAAGVAAPGSLQPGIDEAYSQALKLAEEAKGNLSGNGEVEAWAQKVKARIEGERKKDWLPPKWKLSLPTPRPIESTTAPPTPPAGQPSSTGTSSASGSTPAPSETKAAEAATSSPPASK